MEQAHSSVNIATALNTKDYLPKLESVEQSYSPEGGSDSHVNNHVNIQKPQNDEVTSPTLSDSFPSHVKNESSSQELSPQQSPTSPKQSGSSTGVKLFIGQVPKHFNDAEVRKIFEPYGKILSCDIIKDRATQMHKGCAFLTFSSKSEAEAAIAALHDKLTLPPAKSALQVLFAVGELERLEHKLFVGMLPVGTTEDDLRPVFSSIGELEDLAMIRQPPSATKRCAFVKYKTREDAQKAISSLNGYKMEKNGVSSLITVKFADNEKSKKQKQMQKFQQQQQNVYIPPATYTPYAYAPYPAQYMQYGMPTAPPTMPSMPGGYPPVSTSYYSPYASSYTAQPVPQVPQMAPVPQLPQIPQVPQVQTSQSQAQKILTSQGMQPATAYAQPSYNYNTATTAPTTTPHSSYSAVPSSHGTSASHSSGPPGANLFIYDLPPSYRDHDLYSIFASFGSIVSAKVFIDKNTGESKCFGFVSYSTPESAQSAIAHMNGVQIGEKRLKVSLKRDSQIASQAKTVGSRYTPY